MGNLKQLAGQTAIYGVSTIVSRFLNYLLVPLYTYKLATGAYGVVTEMYAYVAFLNVVLTYGMETAYFRFLSQEKDKSKVFSTGIISLIFTSLVFSVLTIVFAQDIANLIQHPEHPEYVFWFGLIISFDAIVCLPFAKLRAQNKPRRFAVVKLVNILINLSLNVFFIILCPILYQIPVLKPLISMVYDGSIGVKYIFISNIISSGLTLLILMPEMKDIKSGFDRVLLKRMLLYALPLLVFGLAGIFNDAFSRILIKYLSAGDAMSQVGIFGACYKVSILMAIFIQAYKYASEPFFFAKEKDKDAKQTYAEMMNWFIIVTSLIFLGTTLYLHDFIIYFIGPAYRVGAPVIPVLLMANLFLGLYYNLSIWYKLTNQTMYGAYLSLSGAVITLVLNFWWIPKYGFIGAAWTTFICYFAMMVASYMIGQRHYPVNYDIKKIVGYLSLSVLLYLISLLPVSASALLRFLYHTALLFVFLVVVVIFERRKFESIVLKKNK